MSRTRRKGEDGENKRTSWVARMVLSPLGRCSSMLITTQLPMIVRMMTYLVVSGYTVRLKKNGT